MRQQKSPSWNSSDDEYSLVTSPGRLMKKGVVERDLSQLAAGASAVILISCVCIYT